MMNPVYYFTQVRITKSNFQILKNLFNRKAKREEEIQFELIARQFEKYSAYEADSRSIHLRL